MDKETLRNRIIDLFESWAGHVPDQLEPLPLSGSSRIYYRCYSGQKTAIAAYNDDAEENKSFIYLSRFFKDHGLKVPVVLEVSGDSKTYLVEDLGDTSLYALLQDESTPKEKIREYYLQSLADLIDFQLAGTKNLDFSRCYPVEAFDEQAIQWDLNYFKYYFLKLAGIPFNEARLQQGFDQFAKDLLQQPGEYFMYRDFQSRNIMLKNQELFYIDFQGGRRGPLSYDLASLLYNTRADLSPQTREFYLEKYIDLLEDKKKTDRDEFRKHFYTMALARVLQVMGAYGYRGYFERKPYFLSGIPFGIKNLRWLLHNADIDIHPYLREVLTNLVDTKELQDVGKQLLEISVQSFSYKNGLPSDQSGNGGGFVFDCRALPNPGREEQYRALSGKDEAVIQYLQKHDEVGEFVQRTKEMVDASVQKYLQRGFANLSVSFGCTGGQHRSVYCAEQLVAAFSGREDIKIRLRHLQLEGPH